jgi:hypothetical protein
LNLLYILALLRRGTALKGKKDLKGARTDIEKVLEKESNNKTAKVSSFPNVQVVLLMLSA